MKLPLKLSLHPWHTLQEGSDLPNHELLCVAVCLSSRPYDNEVHDLAFRITCASPPNDFGNVGGGCD